MKKSEALKILGLSDGATDEQVKAAHRKKIVANHPDRFTDPAKKQAAEEQTKLINEARDVLLQRRWDPEYGPRTASTGYSTGYGTGNPYGGAYGNPFGGAAYGQQGQGGNPFGGYSWSSWDNVGAGQQGGGFDPFGSTFTRPPQKSAKEEAEEARRALNLSTVTIVLQTVVLALCTAFGGVAIGMFVWIISAIMFAVYREMSGCAAFFTIPLALFVVPMALFIVPFPTSVNKLSMGTIVFFGLAAIYELETLRRDVQAYRTLKEKAKVSG